MSCASRLYYITQTHSLKLFRINNEKDLLIKCKKGNHQAQMSLYQKYAQAMYQISRNIIKDDMQAEEAMQDAFLSAFKNLDQFDGTSTFGAWLKSIVIHTSLDYIRKNKMYQNTVDIEQIHLSISFEEQENIPEFNMLHSGMAQLPENYRTILSLFYLEGYDHKEISEILEISYVNSRVLLKRAKDKLTQIIQEV